MNYYDVDTPIVMTVNFYEADGVTPVDPTTVTIWVQAPDGIQTSYSSPTRVSTGVYTVTVTVSQIGPWIYKGVGTGVVVATTDDTYFQVTPTVFSSLVSA